MSRITAAQWWANIDATLHTLREFVKNAKRADIAENGHECGHQFRFAVTSAMHAGIEGEPPSSHRDAPFDVDAPEFTLTVRANSLRDALAVATTVPLDRWQIDGRDAADWLPGEESS